MESADIALIISLVCFIASLALLAYSRFCNKKYLRDLDKSNKEYKQLIEELNNVNDKQKQSGQIRPH